MPESYPAPVSNSSPGPRADHRPADERPADQRPAPFQFSIASLIAAMTLSSLAAAVAAQFQYSLAAQTITLALLVSLAMYISIRLPWVTREMRKLYTRWGHIQRRREQLGAWAEEKRRLAPPDDKAAQRGEHANLSRGAADGYNTEKL